MVMTYKFVRGFRTTVQFDGCFMLLTGNLIFRNSVELLFLDLKSNLAAGCAKLIMEQWSLPEHGFLEWGVFSVAIGVLMLVDGIAVLLRLEQHVSIGTMGQLAQHK
jgi:hypothetical protein